MQYISFHPAFSREEYHHRGTCTCFGIILELRSGRRCLLVRQPPFGFHTALQREGRGPVEDLIPRSFETIPRVAPCPSGLSSPFFANKEKSARNETNRASMPTGQLFQPFWIFIALIHFTNAVIFAPTGAGPVQTPHDHGYTETSPVGPGIGQFGKRKAS